MRFLCLHGAGTNSQILQSQLAPLIHAVREDRHEFEFIEGSLPCAAAEGIRPIFPEQTAFYQYFDPLKPETFERAVEQVHQLLAAEDPPFEGVIGFSQGAMLAATVLVDHSHDPDRARLPIRCAMFACTPLPYNRKQQSLFKLGDEFPEVIHIPTFHLFGREDPWCQESIGLSRLCDAALRQTYDHGGGHEIPKTLTVTEALAHGLRKCISLTNARKL